MTPPDWEEPLPTIAGRAWAFGTRLDATQILPSRFATLNATAARAHLFADLVPSLALRVVAGDVIVAEEHDGSSASSPPALHALRAAGVVALVGRAFAASIEEAALTAGIVTVSLDAPAFIHSGDRLRIDLEVAKVVNLSSGDRAGIRDLDDACRAALRAMLLARPASG